MKKLTLIISGLILVACSTGSNHTHQAVSLESQKSTENFAEEIKHQDTLQKVSWVKNLQEKRKKSQPIVIHVLVPLCDVENQGVVGVTKRIADGQNPRTNLYWGAGYGISTHFKRSSKWQLLESTPNKTHLILERLVFKHTSAENTFLVADAYRGDSMSSCLTHFLKTLAGDQSLTCLKIDSQAIHPDLVVFNGHNGMMDSWFETPKNKDTLHEGAIVIACASEPYFKDFLYQYGSYPELLTTNLMAPEAYVLHDVLEDWLKLDASISLKEAAGKAYHGIQKCGLKGATNLFTEGW